MARVGEWLSKGLVQAIEALRRLWMTAAQISEVLSLALSRWLIGDWFLHRVADRMAKLRKLEENLGHNGLLVVMAIRLTHVVPFGISNYLLGLTTITLMDAEYPSNLRQVADPPPVLFVRGQLRPQDSHAIALVGTRRATAYGSAAAERLARDLAAAGVTVVSGLAKGVDTVAHRAVVEAGGRTIAVLGNGLDQVYPPENGGLARRIVDREQ